MGLRARLNRIESHVHGTLNQGSGAIEDVREAVVGTIEELLDGFTVDLVVPKDSAGALGKLVAAILKGEPLDADVVLPIGFRVTLKEPV